MRGSKGRFRPAGNRASDSEIETSTAEKVLALVLAIFISIGAIWAYFKLDEVAKPDTPSYLTAQAALDRVEATAIARHARVSRSVSAAQRARRAATRRLEVRREAYRTALDAGETSAGLKAEYESAQAEFTSASRTLVAATAAEARTEPAAAQAEARLADLRQVAVADRDDEQTRHDRIVFLLRLGLLVGMLTASYRLLILLRRRNSRYLPAALALIGGTAVLAVVMAADYTDSYLAFDEVGPLAISITGIALTLVAFVALQRFLAKRIPARRVRRGECSFCGFPLRGTRHCEGCGRAAIASCSSCHRDRRVGTPRCGYCGNP